MLFLWCIGWRINKKNRTKPLFSYKFLFLTDYSTERHAFPLYSFSFAVLFGNHLICAYSIKLWCLFLAQKSFDKSNLACCILSEFKCYRTIIFAFLKFEFSLNFLPTDNDIWVPFSILVLEGVMLPIKYVTNEVRNSLYCYKNLCEHISFSSSPTPRFCIARILIANWSEIG